MTPERVYAALLALYPRAFRDTYGEDMIEAFHELRRTSGLPAVSFWRFAIADLVASACHEQLDACRFGLRRFVLEWLAVCAFGIMGTGLIASLVGWTFAYLYHPYLEGMQLVPWGYGAVLGAGLGIAQSVALRQRARSALAWIAVSAASTALGLTLVALTAAAIGPVGCGIVIGCVVGICQWMLAGTPIHRRGWPVLASALSVPMAIFLCHSWIQRALGGMNPVAADFPQTAAGASYGAAIDAMMRGLQQPRDWMDVAFEFAAMSICGLTIGAITARRLSREHCARQAAR
jgi:hypothetical protein